MRNLSVPLTWRTGLVAVAAAALAMLALTLTLTTANARAAAVVQQGTFYNAWGPQPSYDDCRGLPAVETGSEVFNIRDVLTPAGGIHEQGTDDGTVRLDFDDGSYLISHASFPWEFNFRADTIGEVTKNFQTQIRATLYDADGNPIGAEYVHEVSHVSRIGYFDPGPNDIVHVRFDKVWTTCAD